VGFSVWKSLPTFPHLAFKSPVTQIFTDRLFRQLRNVTHSKLASFLPELSQPSPSCPFPPKVFKEKIKPSQLPSFWKKRTWIKNILLKRKETPLSIRKTKPKQTEPPTNLQFSNSIFTVEGI